MKKYCKVCGEFEEVHHEFDPVMPGECICPPGEWGDEVTEVCAMFEGIDGQACRNCEHDRECHA